MAGFYGGRGFSPDDISRGPLNFLRPEGRLVVRACFEAVWSPLASRPTWFHPRAHSIEDNFRPKMKARGRGPGMRIVQIHGLPRENPISRMTRRSGKNMVVLDKCIGLVTQLSARARPLLFAPVVGVSSTVTNELLLRTRASNPTTLLMHHDPPPRYYGAGRRQLTRSI